MKTLRKTLPRLNRADRWQPLGGKFRRDGEEKVVHVPVGRATNCSMFRVKITSIAEGDVVEPPVDGEGDPLCCPSVSSLRTS